MARPENNKWLDEALTEIIESKKLTTDFEKWKQDHPQAVELLISRAKQASAPAGRSPAIGSILMKNRTLRYAAGAAILIVAATISIRPFLGATITFAKVVEPILNARTIAFDVIAGDEETGPVMHEVLAGSRIRRTFSNMPNTVKILDVVDANMLVLNTDTKTASYVELKKVEDDIKFLREAIVKLQDESRAERLGERRIAGKKGVGFAAGPPKQRVTIWADPETALPIRVELVFGNLSMVLKNFAFNVPIDASLVSMKVPPGYTLAEDAHESHK